MQYPVSFYAVGKNSTSSENMSIETVLQHIRNGKWYAEVSAYLSLPEEEKAARKIMLPGFTPHGTFGVKRNIEHFQDHSGIYCLDLDHDLSARIPLQSDPYTYALHSSVSGTGLAIYVKAHNLLKHKDGYMEVLEYYESKYSIKIDSVCHDLPRLRFVSHDPYLYWNPDSLVFGQQPKISVQEATQMLFGDELSNAMDQLEQNRIDILDDSYEVCMKMAYALLSELPPFEAESYMRRLYALSPKYSRYPDVELNRRWNEWRKHHQSRGSTGSGSCTIGTFWYKANQKGGIKSSGKRQLVERSLRTNKRSGVAPEQAVKEALRAANTDVDKQTEAAMATLATYVYSEPEVTIGSFWFVDEKERLVIDEKRLLCDWLPGQGVLHLKHSEGYELVRVQDKVIHPIEIIELKQMVMFYVSTLPWEFDGVERYQLETAIIKNAKAIFMMDKLHFLPTLQANMLRDGKQEGRFFFSNGWLSIKPDGWELLPYAVLPGYIWSSQVKDRDYAFCTADAMANCEFARLLFNMCGQDYDRYMGLTSAIGYALHTYKDPSRPYAVILQDQEMGDEPQGGTGKDLVMKAIGNLRNVVYQSGKAFDPMKNFAFQRVDRRTELVVLQDLRKGVTFESLFNIISDGIEVERKHKDQYLLSFDESPKIAITTNYPLKASGTSNARRKGKGEIEIAPHYNPGHTPFDEFGHVLFLDWSPQEWQLFDNFMASCLRGYLAHGLAASPDVKRSENALRAYTEEGFGEWMDAWWQAAEKDPRGWAPFRSSLLYGQYVSEASSDITLDRFGKWVRTWAAARGRKVEKKGMTYKAEKAQWTLISPLALP